MPLAITHHTVLVFAVINVFGLETFISGGAVLLPGHSLCVGLSAVRGLQALILWTSTPYRSYVDPQIWSSQMPVSLATSIVFCCLQEAGRFRHDVGCAAIAVDWAPTLGRPYDLVAVSFGATVTVFKVTGTPTKLDIDVVSQLRNPSSVWRIEFSLTTSTLACSLSDPAEIWLWMPSFSGSWRPVSRIVSGKGC